MCPLLANLHQRFALKRTCYQQNPLTHPDSKILITSPSATACRLYTKVLSTAVSAIGAEHIIDLIWQHIAPQRPGHGLMLYSFALLYFLFLLSCKPNTIMSTTWQSSCVR